MRASSQPLVLCLLIAVAMAPAASPQEHDHSQHNHGDPSAPPKPHGITCSLSPAWSYIS